ncbi:MAG: O-methyltransferase [Bacteroidetes bacterium]|nr:O-methyltransferase [Bacteroidota bacterium]
MQHHLTSEAINTYAENISTPESELLRRLNRETHAKVELPIMLSGHLQGALLAMLSRMIRPKRILELGTYTGYSAICLAQGLPEGGMLHTIDINEELAERCQRYWKEAGLEDKITMHIGPGASIIPSLDEVFDLVFIDADKQGYAQYFDLIIDRLPQGAFIFADNVLYDAEVVLPEAEQSKNAKAIVAFNEKVKNDPRVEQVLLPVRDGILIMRKL